MSASARRPSGRCRLGVWLTVPPTTAHPRNLFAPVLSLGLLRSRATTPALHVLLGHR